jgi:hypothetical protein
MNIRKGFFRLTLILSILVGIISSFWVLEHTIENEYGIVKKCLPYGLQISVDNEWKARTTERLAEKVYPYDFKLLHHFFSETHKSFGPDYILFWWRHLAIFSLPGFVAVWFIYNLARWVIIPFIVRGFQSSSKKGGNPLTH